MADRYTVSLSALHSLMVAHLKELELYDVSNGLEEQIPVIMLLEKEMGTRDWFIENSVVDFFEGCRAVGSAAEFVLRFHAFMETMLRGYLVGFDLQEKFQSTVANVKMSKLLGFQSIQDLTMFVQGVTYTNSEG